MPRALVGSGAVVVAGGFESVWDKLEGVEVACSRSEEEYEGNYGVSKCSRAFEAVSGDTRPTTRLAAKPSRRWVEAVLSKVM